MSNQLPIKKDDRERALYRYTSALERGDFDTVAAMLREAEADTILEQMILEINEVFSEETLINDLLHQHMPSAVANDEEAEPPAPVTVSEVMARLKSDVETTRDIRREMDEVSRKLHGIDEPLPANLNLRSVRQLFARLELSASQSFQKLFREAAIFLSMGREQRILAAARRQKIRRNETKEQQ